MCRSYFFLKKEISEKYENKFYMSLLQTKVTHILILQTELKTKKHSNKIRTRCPKQRGAGRGPMSDVRGGVSTVMSNVSWVIGHMGPPSPTPWTE